MAVYRDYHAENLIWLPERAGHARVGLLDFQDMLVGHPAYDLVSLLEDARRDVAPELRAAMLGALPRAQRRRRRGARRTRRTRSRRSATSRSSASSPGSPAATASRATSSYLPRVWGHLAADLAHPALAPLAALVARHLPPPEPAVLARIGAAA